MNPGYLKTMTEMEDALMATSLIADQLEATISRRDLVLWFYMLSPNYILPIKSGELDRISTEQATDILTTLNKVDVKVSIRYLNPAITIETIELSDQALDRIAFVLRRSAPKRKKFCLFTPETGSGYISWDDGEAIEQEG